MNNPNGNKIKIVDQPSQSLAKQALINFNSSIEFDRRLAEKDIACAIAHTNMLLVRGVLTPIESANIINGLNDIAADAANEKLHYRHELEDVHSNIEAELARRVGADAFKIRPARARNDLAVTSLRLWVRDQCDQLVTKLTTLAGTFTSQARNHCHTVMPGNTHLQGAQVISFGHLCMAYAEMFFRDARRILTLRGWLNESPLGSCALAGTSLLIDRQYVARELGFGRPTANSLDGVADRDFVLDFLSACATAAIHASRFAEDTIIYSTSEFGFYFLPDNLISKSMIMPHKRNPDPLELIRGKAGRMFGNLSTVQTVLKGLSLSYSRDLQEDKEAIFDSADTLNLVLTVLQVVIDSWEIQIEKMAAAAGKGFLNSIDYVEWLFQERKIPYAECHQIVVRLVDVSRSAGCELDDLSDEIRLSIDARLRSPWPRISARQSIDAKQSFGGPAPNTVLLAAENMEKRLRELILS